MKRRNNPAFNCVPTLLGTLQQVIDLQEIGQCGEIKTIKWAHFSKLLKNKIINFGHTLLLLRSRGRGLIAPRPHLKNGGVA